MITSIKLFTPGATEAPGEARCTTCGCLVEITGAKLLYHEFLIPGRATTTTVPVDRYVSLELAPLPEFTAAASTDVEFNILAPAVIDDHVTLGFTYTRDNGDEITAAYMHGFENDVKGPSLFFGGEDEIQMSQDAVGIQYSWKM